MNSQMDPTPCQVQGLDPKPATFNIIRNCYTSTFRIGKRNAQFLFLYGLYLMSSNRILQFRTDIFLAYPEHARYLPLIEPFSAFQGHSVLEGMSPKVFIVDGNSEIGALLK